MSVMAEDHGRGDILLERGVSNRLAVLWRRDEGGGFRPVDLSGYACVFEMRLPGSDDIVYSRECDAHGDDGEAAVLIPPAAFTDAVWASRRTGEWRMTAARDGVVELLGAGYWHLA